MQDWTEKNKQLAKHWLAALPAVRAYAIALVPNPSDADEVIQSVALKVVEKFGEYDEARPFVNWALGIARFEVLNRRRTYARDQHVFSERAMEVVEQAAIQVGGECDRRESALQICLAELGEDARLIIEYRYASGLSVQAIAERLGRRPNTVSMSLTRTRRALRACVDRRLDEGDEGRDA